MPSELRNVLVCSAPSGALVVELRWVRDVVRMPTICPVPTAPRSLLGVARFEGAPLPVMATHVLLAQGGVEPEPPAHWDTALLLEVDGARLLLPITRVDEVTTLPACGDESVDLKGATTLMVSPERLIERIDRDLEQAARGFLARLGAGSART